MFDVFLCHNSADKPTIRAIAAQLQQHNISCWLDEEQLPPGCHWLDTQERDMSQLKAVAVFVGGNGIGKWQRIEISIFLQRFVEHDLRVIPVFLADAPPETEMPMFLKLFTWVDFRRTAPDPMQLLIQGINRDRSDANPVPIAEVKRIIAADIKSKFHVPYLRNVYFTGRSQLLQGLHSELTRTGVAALSQMAAIAGLGGIGKTQTAVEYAYRHFSVD
ncbi:MAG: toll/interleukin-1 receptor domain-containing protein, partial [Phormidesmis sp. CAN_BIN36]|nr:toll/interleukin-1 receptor domain-containing protein [Phormidesmis sp. CAN_BIN36]